MPSPSRVKRRGREAVSEEKSSEGTSNAEEEAIAAAIEKSDKEFILDYLQPGDENWASWTHPKTNEAYTFSLSSPNRLTESELETCFDLIDQTSGQDYRTSSAGWHPAVKRKEMRSPEMRYLIVRSATEDIRGFASFMPTFEYGDPVVYVYEIHLQIELQGTGLGRHLMTQIRTIASNIPHVRKVMLTCFKSNAAAYAFYLDRLGLHVDENSPRDRKLRGGKVVTSDYVILGWRI